MQIEPVLLGLRATLDHQRSLAGGDAAVDEATTWLVEALSPAFRMAAFELAQQAAAEVGAQLDDREVAVVVDQGDPAIRISDASTSRDDTSAEDLDARITLRLPPSLKRLIEDSASTGGDSVNAWVVDALSQRAKKASRRGGSVTESFDL